MRNTFIRTLTDLAGEDERIILLTADLGYTVLEQFAEKYPARYLNVGVAEQNMIGLATGLAEAGFIPFIYSIATFASLRGYEFLRNGPIKHQFTVRVVSIGGGFEYGTAGLTHHALEDIAVMRTQPGLSVIAPADYQQAEAALRATWHRSEPIYYRLGKNEQLTIPGLDGKYQFEKPEVIGEGQDLLIVTMGNAASTGAEAMRLLNAESVGVTMAIVSTLHPPSQLNELLSRFKHVISIEDHYLAGGVGSMTAEAIAEGGFACHLTRMGVKTLSDGRSGSQDYLRAKNGLSPQQVVTSALSILAHQD